MLKRFITAVAAAMFYTACHSHDSDDIDVVPRAWAMAANVWPGAVKSVSCGPCMCVEGADCTPSRFTTCVVTTDTPDGGTGVHYIQCLSDENAPCDLGHGWEEQHMKVSK